MILCCGEALIDMLPEHLANGQFCFTPRVGGSVFNTAVALGRLSSDVTLFSGISYDLKGKSSNNENSIVRPVKNDTILPFKELNERKRPNMKTKRLWV